MTKKELIQALMAGKKMTRDAFTSPNDTYCYYDEKYSNPFRFVNLDNNSDMDGVWDYTNWREVEEFSFEPKDGETWWYVHINGEVYNTEIWMGTVNKCIINQGSFFPTKEEAIKFSEWQKAAYRLKKCIWELNGNQHRGFITGEDNYFIGYNSVLKTLDVTAYRSHKSAPSWFYLDNKDLAQQLIKEMSDDLKIYLEY